MGDGDRDRGATCDAASRASMQGFDRTMFRDRLLHFGQRDKEEAVAAAAAAQDARRTPPKPQHQVQQYSFRTGSFFGSKLNVRSSIPRLVAEEYVHGKFPKQYFHTAQPPAAPPLPAPVHAGRLSPSQGDVSAALQPVVMPRSQAAPASAEQASGEDLPCTEASVQRAEGVVAAANGTLPPQCPERETHAAAETAAQPSSILPGGSASTDRSHSPVGPSSAPEAPAAGSTASNISAAGGAQGPAAQAAVPAAHADGAAQAQRHLHTSTIEMQHAQGEGPELARSAQGNAQLTPHSAAHSQRRSSCCRSTAHCASSAADIRKPSAQDILATERSTASAAVAVMPWLPSDVAAPSVSRAAPTDHCTELAPAALPMSRQPRPAGTASQQAGLPQAPQQSDDDRQAARAICTGDHTPPEEAAVMPIACNSSSCSEASARSSSDSGSTGASSGDVKASWTGSSRGSTDIRCKGVLRQHQASADAWKDNGNPAELSSISGSSSVRYREGQPLENSDLLSTTSSTGASSSIRSSGSSSSRSSSIGIQTGADASRGTSRPGVASDTDRSTHVPGWTPRSSSKGVARPAAASAGGGVAAAASRQPRPHSSSALQPHISVKRSPSRRQTRGRPHQVGTPAKIPILVNVLQQKPDAAPSVPRQMARPAATAAQPAAKPASQRLLAQKVPLIEEPDHPVATPYRGIASHSQRQPRQPHSPAKMVRPAITVATASQSAGLPPHNTPRKAPALAAAAAAVAGTPTRPQSPGYAAMAALRRQRACSPAAAIRLPAAASSGLSQHISMPTGKQPQRQHLKQEASVRSAWSSPSMPGKGGTSALQLLATCGADAKLAATAAAASSPIVGVITQVYTPPTTPGSSPTRSSAAAASASQGLLHSPADVRSKANAEANAESLRAAALRPGAEAGAASAHSEASGNPKLQRADGAALQNGPDEPRTPGKGAEGRTGGAEGPPSWLPDPDMNPFETLAQQRWDDSGSGGHAAGGSNGGKGAHSSRGAGAPWQQQPATDGPLGAHVASLHSEMRSKYGPPALSRYSPLTLEEAAVAATGRRSSYLEDSAALQPVNLRSQLAEAMRMSPVNSRALAKQQQKLQPADDYDAVQRGCCCSCFGRRQ